MGERSLFKMLGMLVTVSGNTFSSNSAYSGPPPTNACSGGGIYIVDGGTVLINSNMFYGNFALSDGGAIADQGAQSITISNNSFTTNSIFSGNGGAISTQSEGSVLIQNNLFSDDNGGGAAADIFNGNESSGSVTITGNNFGFIPNGNNIFISNNSVPVSITNNTFALYQDTAIGTDGSSITTAGNSFPPVLPTPTTTFIDNIIGNASSQPSASDANVVSAVTSDITHIIYVNQNAPGSVHDGSSWSHAFLTLQDALNAAAATPGEDQIWVAQGTYSPAVGSTYYIPSGVAIFGGFAGTETSLASRPNATTNLLGSNIMTMINGDAILDGFSLENTTAINGSGIQLYNSDMLIFNSSFTSFHALGDGGAINAYYGYLTIMNSQFMQNISITGSGGAVNSYGSFVTVGYSLFSGNSADGINSSLVPTRMVGPGLNSNGGGAIAIQGTGDILNSPYVSGETITNSTFTGNTSNGNAGAVLAITLTLSGTFTLADVYVTDSKFNGNSANDDGGAIFTNDISYDYLTNDSFVSNSAGGSGGAVGGMGNTIVDGSSFLSNSALGNGGAINIAGLASGSINNSDFEHNSAGGDGGAVYAHLSSITGDTFLSNSALGDGRRY